MKKILKKSALRLSLMASLFMSVNLAACGGDDDESPTNGGEDTTKPGSVATYTDEIAEPSFTGSLYPANDSTTAHADTDLMIKFDSAPTVDRTNADLKIRIKNEAGTEVDAIGSFGEKYYSANNSKGAIGEINVDDQLITVVGNTVLIKVHNDDNAYTKLADATKYTVTIDSGLITGTVGGADPSTLAWSFTTAAAPTISGNEITVGGEDANFASINGAFNYIRKNALTADTTIKVAAGSYHERLFGMGDKANINLIGETSSEGKRGDKVTVYWENNEKLEGNSGARARCSFYFYGTKNLFIQHITFINTTNRQKFNYSDTQAETLSWDASGQLIVNKCSFYSYQDTLYLGAKGGRAWFYDDYIAGDVDFIWGYGDTVLVEDCNLVARADGIKNNAYLLAPRSYTDAEANKGFVVLNCTVTVEDGCVVNHGRNSGADYNGLVINTKYVSGGSNASFNGCMWGNKVGQKDGANEDFFDAAKDIAIGFKDYGNTWDGKAIDDSARGASYALPERVANREYNGRRAILNRGFNTTDSVYKVATTAFDFGDYETEFGASEDASVNNIYVEPVYVLNVVGGKSAGTFTVTDAEGNAVTDATWTSSDEKIATVASGTVSTIENASGLVKITASKDGARSDYAQVVVIADALKMNIAVGSTGTTVEAGTTQDYTQTLVLELDLGDESKVSSKAYAANITGDDASQAIVSYTSELDTIASVAEDGTVTAKHIGNVVVTVYEKQSDTTYKYLVHVKNSKVSGSYGVILSETLVHANDKDVGDIKVRDFGAFSTNASSNGNALDRHGWALGGKTLTVSVTGPSIIYFCTNDNNSTAGSEVTAVAANEGAVTNAVVAHGKTKTNETEPAAYYESTYSGEGATTITYTFPANVYVPSFSVVNTADAAHDVLWDFTGASDYTVKTNMVMVANGSIYGIVPDPDTGAILVSNNSGKLTPRAPANGDAQINANTVVYIPVSQGSVVTVKAKSGSYKIGDAQDAITKTEMTTEAAASAGWVKLACTSNGYLYSIAVTNLKNEARNDPNSSN